MLDFINRVFQRKTLVIELMNVGERAGRRRDSVGRTDVNFSFPEHNSATVRNISTVLGRIVEQ